jgi:hypothetical protein
VRQCGSVWQCARQYVEVRTVMCTKCARQGAAVRLGCVWQCGSAAVQQCSVIVRTAVCGIAFVLQCVAVYVAVSSGSLWQCVGQCAHCIYAKSRSQYILIGMPLNKR